MNDRSTIKENEFALLKQARNEHPELFQQKTIIDDEATLRSIGIELPGKENYPIGYLKLLPQDFIVEEISPDGQIHTVEHENLLSEDITAVHPADQTVYATLVKCGVSTIDVVEDICRVTGCTKEQIQYAGIKDKDAITAQRISFRNISIEKLKAVSSRYFFLKDLASGKGSIQKSGLKGNRFTIFIRTESDFKTTEKFYIFAENLKKVIESGFYNFYYLQRFGTPRLNNYIWAISILKGDYRQAVHDVLAMTGKRELNYFKEIRRRCSEHFGDWQYVESLLSPLPLMFSNELRMVRHLMKAPEDFSGALNAIPDQVTLWVYAISSFLFNKKISDDINKHSAVPKDLPLFLSYDKKDWGIYEPILKELGIFPPPFHNFKPFRFLQMRSRIIPTKETVEIHRAELVPGGVVISFTLNKGGYATTFLSHLFTLTSGLRPENISQVPCDAKEALKEGSLRKTLQYFEKVIDQKKDSVFEETGGQ